MADKTVSNITSNVNENKLIHVEFLHDGAPAVRSDVVAEHFNRSHKNVLRDIAKLRPKCPESFYRLNFELVEHVDAKGEKRPAYFLTRDAFSLLVMRVNRSSQVR